MTRNGSIASKLEALTQVVECHPPDRLSAPSFSDYWHGRDDPKVALLQAEAREKDFEIKTLKLEVARLQLEIARLEMLEKTDKAEIARLQKPDVYAESRRKGAEVSAQWEAAQAEKMRNRSAEQIKRDEHEARVEAERRSKEDKEWRADMGRS